jgi:bis(5'-nucleosyl)-tetraphosphatase (symmetrical)
MATYAIGDIQGCFEPLQRLLREINYRADRDRIWLAGDLVNRGPQSLEVLRWCRAEQDNVTAVLGNHDIHLLAVASDLQPQGPKDTLDTLLNATDRDELVQWVRTRPLIHHEEPYMLVHAGLLASWTQGQALALASEVEDVLRGPDGPLFLTTYRDHIPPSLEDATSSLARARFILAVLTRIRACDIHGRPDWSYKGSLEDIPEHLTPWFNAPTRAKDRSTLLCGHWAALGLSVNERHVALDTGCVWGRTLTAMRLDDKVLFQVAA